MTTLVTLATKDAVALGCDSLATSTKLLLDPFEVLDFFDEENDYALRMDAEGKPGRFQFRELLDRSRQVPYNHMTDVDKLVDLSPLPMGFMFTGIASIGDRTVKSLVAELRHDDKAFKNAKSATNFTVNSVSERLLGHLGAYYDRAFGDFPEVAKPPLGFLIGGYDKRGPLPKVVRGSVAERKREPCYSPGIAFAGMMQEIQRIVLADPIEERSGNGDSRLEGVHEGWLSLVWSAGSHRPREQELRARAVLGAMGRFLGSERDRLRGLAHRYHARSSPLREYNAYGRRGDPHRLGYERNRVPLHLTRGVST